MPDLPIRIPALIACFVVPVSFVAGCSSASAPDTPVYEILYAVNPSDTAGGEIHAVLPDGTSDRVLGVLPGPVEGLSVGPDGTIAVSAKTGTYTANLFLMPAQGGSGQPVLTIADPEALWPGWSPDGSRLVFEMGSGGWPQIQMVDRDGSNVHLVTDGSDGFSYYTPAWSPDGDRLVCRRMGSGGYIGLTLMRTDGSGKQILTSGLDMVPAWSPDGSRIAFARSSISSAEDIYTIAPDTTGLQRLTTNDSSDTWPSWSPDGARIAFQSNREGTFHIYVMNADGSGVSRVTNQTGAQLYPKWRIAP
ncbi:MAG: hypothetical protein P8174_10220 [Gemmatimonadota bacterium]